MSPSRDRVRPTRVGWVLLGLATLLWLAGSNIGSGWVVLVAAALVGATATDAASARHRAAGTLVHASVTVGGAHPSVEVRASASSPLGSTRVEVPAAGGRVVSTGLGPHGGTWRLLVGPGRLRLVEVVGTAVGPLNLARCRWTASVETDVVVPVEVYPAATRWAALRGPDGDVGSPAPGGEMVRGVREHFPGAPAGSVHWRASARHGRLLVRDSERPAGPDVRVVVGAGAWTPPTMALAVAVASSLGAAGAAAGQPVLIEVDGVAHPWSPTTRFDLATTPPLRGGSPSHGAWRPRASTPTSDVSGAVRLDPVPEGVVATDSGGSTLLRDEAEVRAWL